jgi:hypothetical protein
MPLASVAPETRVEAVVPDTPTKPDALQALNDAAASTFQSKKSAAARSVRVSMVRSQSTVTRQQLAVDSGDVDSLRQFVAEEAINAITNHNEAPTNFHQVCACTWSAAARCHQAHAFDWWCRTWAVASRNPFSSRATAQRREYRGMWLVGPSAALRHASLLSSACRRSLSSAPSTLTLSRLLRS